jgi:hypothetical protein
MPEIPPHRLGSVQYVPVLSFRFALRCTLCLVLTAFNAGVIAFAGTPLYQVTAGHPLQVFGVSILFAALLGSLVRVWIVALRSHNR